MSKWGLAGTSLAAAIPGGILFFMLLMAVLNSFEPMPMILKVVSIASLIVALTMGLFPLYALIYGPSSAGAPPKKRGTPAGEDDDVPAVGGDDDEALEDVAETTEFSDAEVEAFEDEEFGEEFGDDFDDEFESEEASADDFDAFDDELEGDFDDEFEFEEFDEDDDR